MKKLKPQENLTLKDSLWTGLSFLSLGCLLIAILAIGWRFNNSSTTTFQDLVALHRLGLSGVAQNTYILLVVCLFFASLACVISLTILILELCQKPLPSRSTDLIMTILIVMSIIFAISGMSIYLQDAISRANAQPKIDFTIGMYLLLVAPLVLMVLPWTSDYWKVKKPQNYGQNA